MNRWKAPDSSSEEEGTRRKSEETETKESFHNPEPEQEPTIEELASSSQSQKQELPKSPAQTLKVETPKTSPQELDDMAAKETRINLPKEFTGDQNDVSSFLQDVDLYIIMNLHIYDTNDKKITFILSFLTDGAAWTWKESFLTKNAKKEEGYNLGTTTAFTTALEDAFSPSDVAGNAQAGLQNLKQTGSADEYVSQFWILAGQSGIISSIVLIKYFMEGLKPSILDKIYALEKIPTDITGWYTQASWIDNQWHQVQEIKARNKGINLPKQQNHMTPRYKNMNMTTRDPNAIDVDCLTIEEWTDHYKKGLCFTCHQPGHIGKDCPNRIKRTTPNQPINLKKTGKGIYATIQSLASELDEEEKTILTQELEKEGFQ